MISFEVNRIYLRRGTFLYRARIYEEVDGALKYQDKSNTKFKGYDEINSYVSVASIEVCERLKILDLSTDTIWLAKRDEKKESIIPGIENGFMCLYLHELFKRPYQYKFDYLVTQYIAEKIKNNGFDGIFLS